MVVVYFLAFTPVSSLVFADRGIKDESAAVSKIPVVMLLFDELSLAAITTADGEIDAGRLSNFSRLERISTWYRNTTTVSTQTEKAVPAILSGIRPDKNTQPNYGEFPRNLFTLLADSHTITAMEVYTRLCPKDICSMSGSMTQSVFDTMSTYRDVWFIWLHSMLPSDLAGKYLPSISNSWHNFSREEDSTPKKRSKNRLRIVDDLEKDQSLRFDEFVSSIRKSTGATVNYLHVALPHIPWKYLPDGTIYNGIGTPGLSESSGYAWIDDQYLVDEVVLRYSLQVEYTDFLLGQALDALEESGQLNRVMLIVASDHGIAFKPGAPARIPEASTLADVSRVPLFIKYPEQLSGIRDERKIETIDILPTVADFLGLRLSKDVNGQSLIADNWHPVKRHVLEADDNFPDFEHQLDMRAASDRFYRILKPGKSALDAIGLGSGREYIRKPAPVPTRKKAGLLLQPDNTNWYREVDVGAGFLPARMTGWLAGANYGAEIMVALNGTVAGSGMTSDEDGYFSIMLDPRLFRSGENEIRAFSVDTSEILEISVDPGLEEWNIRRNGANIVSVTDNQGLNYQQDNTLEGRATYSAANQFLYGYACDETLRIAPKAMLFVEGDTVITTVFRMTNKPLLSAEDGIPDLKCWFTVAVSPDWLRKDAVLLALFEGGRMMEIHPKN